ncbi:leucine-rich repeat domain-containing protein [Microscilla marina]|uniref:Leucine-rich repeat containing protein n=1 Tax=Microscilla marina ATCC 23134 TaxID=313606 RepID=A1ZWS0_MICM2|nr:leucine-rich repeat domain-containing protein [Microscilla marina]EAY25202.1 leucine-rich repeat containing protein [Microscilla marina ATCC 23134]
MKRYLDFEAALKEAAIVQDLFYGHKKLKTLDDRVGDFPGLLKLGINHNRLKTLPASFARLDKLEYLDINKNYFVDLPDVLFENKSLKVLIAKHNRIKVVSPRIAEWQALEKLDLRDNLLKKLPEALGTLPCLKEVVLQKNFGLDLEQAIEVLCQLPQGLHLSLNDCNLRKLPANFTKLQNVTSLDISANFDLDLGHTIKQLTKLKNLECLYFCHPMEADEKLPTRFTRLKHLKVLHLFPSANIADILPEFTQLTVLDMARWGWFDNAPDTLPEWMLALDKLEYLSLHENRFTYLTPGIARLHRLRCLDLDGNLMKDMPPGLADIFHQLDTLVFTKNTSPYTKKQAFFLQELQALKQQLSPDTIKIAFYLYQNHWQQAQEMCHNVYDLIPLLELKTTHVVKYTLTLIEQYIVTQRQVPITAESVLFLAGKATQYEVKEVKRVLKTQQVKISATLHAQVTHVVLAPGFKDKEALLQQHLNRYPQTQCFTEGLLKQWYQQQMVSLPLMSDKNLEKITHLLLSSDTRNIMLGLSLMQNFVIPPALYSNLAALYLYTEHDKALHKLVKKLFAQYLPALLQALVLGYASSASAFDQARIQQIGQVYASFSVERFIDHAFACKEYGKEKIFEQGGRFFARVIECLTTKEYKNNQAIPWLTVNFEVAKVADQIKDIAHIQRLKFETFNNQAARSLLIPTGIERLPNLTHLYFTYWYSPQIPQRLTQFRQLEELSMNFHQLTAIPAHISKFTKLRVLILSHGQINQIAPSITQLGRLEKLDLMDNKLTEVPGFIGQMTSLESLILRDNQLTTLPPEIGQLTQLRVLNLGNNPLTALPEELTRLTNLIYVNVSDKTLARQVKKWLPNCRVN